MLWISSRTARTIQNPGGFEQGGVRRRRGCMEQQANSWDSKDLLAFFMRISQPIFPFVLFN
jgi:hypothetical protein